VNDGGNGSAERKGGMEKGKTKLTMDVLKKVKAIKESKNDLGV